MFQVINVNDYQVILSSDQLPATWQGKRIRTNTNKLTSLPALKPKMAPGQVSFTPLQNINILGQNQFSAIVIKDGKSTVSKNILAGNTVVHQNSSSKKGLSKTSKTFKLRKKPVQTKKIMLKPASSLLTQTALDCKNEDCTATEGELVGLNISHLPVKIKPSDAGIDSIIKVVTEPITLVSALPASTSSVISKQSSVHPVNSSNTPNSHESNNSNTTPTLNEPRDYSENVGHEKCIEEVALNTKNVKLVDCLATNNNMEIYSEPSINEPSVILHSNECPEDQKNEVDADQGVSSTNCTLQQAHQNIEENNSNIQSFVDLTREDFQRDNIETIILPSDIEHHEGKDTILYLNILKYCCFVVDTLIYFC